MRKKKIGREKKNLIKLIMNLKLKRKKNYILTCILGATIFIKIVRRKKLTTLSWRMIKIHVRVKKKIINNKRRQAKIALNLTSSM